MSNEIKQISKKQEKKEKKDQSNQFASITRSYEENRDVKRNQNKQHNNDLTNFEMYIKKYVYKICNNHIDFNQILSFKTSECFSYLNYIVIDAHNFNFLIFKDVKQVSIQIIQIYNCYPLEVQLYLTKIKQFFKEKVIFKPVYLNLINKKKEFINSYIINMSQLNVKLIDFVHKLNQFQRQQIEYFIHELYYFFITHNSLIQYISENIIDYIILTQEGQIFLDYIYFLNIKYNLTSKNTNQQQSKKQSFYKSNQSNKKQLKDQTYNQLQEQNEEQHFQYSQNQPTSNINNNDTNYDMVKQYININYDSNQNDNNLDHNNLDDNNEVIYNNKSKINKNLHQKLIQILDIIMFKLTEKTERKESIQTKNQSSIFTSLSTNYSRNNTTLSNYYSTYTSNLSANQSSSPQFEFRSNQALSSYQENKNFITEKSIDQSKQSTIFINEQEQNSKEKNQQTNQEDNLKIKLDEHQKDYFQVKIFKVFQDNLNTVVQNLKQDSSDHEQRLLNQGFSQNEINLNIYQAFVKIAKKIFYKHIVQKSMQLYSESTFYYSNIMEINNEIKEEQNERSKQQNLLYPNNENNDHKVVGDIKFIQLSLKEYLTKEIMQNPIRFKNCIKHFECFDYSSLEYLKQLKQCPECKEYCDEYYYDSYLQFILDFFSKYQSNQDCNKITQTIDNNQINLNELNFYQVESVRCMVESGIFIPQIDFLEQQDQNVSQLNSIDNQDYLNIPNIIDEQYLYYIVKQNTKQIQDKYFQNQFIFGNQDEDENEYIPIITILDFRRFNITSETFGLGKFFNEYLFMEFPVRSCLEACNHVACFDLSDLILKNKPENFNLDKLQCPICPAVFKLDDIVFDKEYQKIVQYSQKKANENYQFFSNQDHSKHQSNYFVADFDFQGNTISFQFCKKKQIDQIIQKHYSLKQFTQKDNLMMRQYSTITNDNFEEEYYFNQNLIDKLYEGVYQDSAFGLDHLQLFQEQSQNQQQNDEKEMRSSQYKLTIEDSGRSNRTKPYSNLSAKHEYSFSNSCENNQTLTL